jgi:aspartate-semialdehyde dehydrogenase
VNGGDVDWHSGILSTPNCTTVPLVMALWPEHRQNPLKRVVVSTYQAVSGTGAAAIEELRQQSTSIATGGEAPTPAVYPHQIAFNALPQVDSFEEDGYTKEEHKMANETRKILHDQQIRFSATCVRIPVYYSHSEAVNAEFERPVDPAAFRNGLKTMAGVRVLDDPAGSQYPTPLNAEGLDEVLVGRIRADASAPGSIAFWLACDNIRKGAALNAVQIAETLIARNRL